MDRVDFAMPKNLHPRHCFLGLFLLLAICGIWLCFYYLTSPPIPFSASGVTRVVVVFKKKEYSVSEAEDIQKIIRLLERSSRFGCEAGGMHYLRLDFYRDDEFVEQMWVGTYCELGYHEKIFGYSCDLQSTLIRIIDDANHENLLPTEL